MIRNRGWIGGLLALLFAVSTVGCVARNPKLAARKGVAVRIGEISDTDLDQLICWAERPVGSNIPERVCKTRRQLAEERRDAQDLMNRSIRQKIID